MLNNYSNPLRYKSILIIIFLFSLLSSCSNAQKEKTDPQPGDTYTQYMSPFNGTPATKDLVIYEVNLRAFSQAGNLKGVINRLGEIKALGTTTIWLMPIYELGIQKSVNSPYSIKNYKKIDPEFGTLEDLRQLTQQAHQMGMAVILDWVANHTSWDNEWILQHKDWYTQNASGEIIHPVGTNWTDVADLNYENVKMRFAMIDAMMYWALEANIDGFRCDHADGVPFDFWHTAIERINSIPKRSFIFLAEGSRTDHLGAGFNLIYAWDFYYNLKAVFNGSSAQTVFTTHLAEYSNLSTRKHRLRYTTNHDESAWEGTPINFFKNIDGALAASVLTIFMGGVPLNYSGQEVGRANKTPFFTKSPIEWSANPEMLATYKKLFQIYTNESISREDVDKDFSTNDVVMFLKTVENEQLFILVNTRNKNVTVNLNTSVSNRTWTNLYTNTLLSTSTQISLGSFEFLILKK